MIDMLSGDSISKLEKMVDEFDQNMKIVDFYLDTESYYDLDLTMRNITKINNLLADSSRMLANIHAIRYEFTPEYQHTIYDRVNK